MVKLGAELGSIFIEFWNDKTSQQGVKKVKGRIYDGCEIKTCYIEEGLYREHFFPDSAKANVEAATTNADCGKVDDERPVADVAEVADPNDNEDHHDDQEPHVNSSGNQGAAGEKQ